MMKQLGRGMAIDRLEARRLLSAGDPDASFGAAGQVEYAQLVSHRLEVVDTFALPDGKFLQGGAAPPHLSGQGLQAYYFLRKVNADGSPDTSFGAGGTVLGVFTPNAGMTVQNVAVAPDGKIYMVGLSTTTFLARFNADGSPDTAFGGGRVVIDTINAVEMIVQPDGKVVLIDDIGRMRRYQSSGVLDATFGGDGTIDAPLTASFLPSAFVVRVQPDGKLLVGGRAGPDFDSFRAALARLNPDGSLDTTFGTGGLVLGAIPGTDAIRIDDIVLLPGGKLLACGTAPDGAFGAAFALARYNADGTIDASYGSGGVANLPSGAALDHVLLDADGNAVVIGGANRSVVVARLTPQGQLDEAFGRIVLTGLTTPTARPNLRAQASVIQRDGKLVLAGTRSPFGQGDATFLTRLHMADDGAPSPVSFNPTSRVMTINGTPSHDLLLMTEIGSVIHGISRGFGRVFDAAHVARIDVFAGEGNDYIVADGVQTVPLNAFGGLGTDKIAGGAANDTLEGSGGNDFIDGNDGDDLILGGSGNDALRGLAGRDTLAGGPGDDIEADIELPDVSYDGKGVLTFTDSDNDDDQVSIWEDGAGGLVVCVEGVTATISVAAVKAIILNGGNGDDLLKLNPGVTIISTLFGGEGNDTLIGGANFDELFGGAGDDYLFGNATRDDIDGGDGDDSIRGGAGDDFIESAGGNDRVDGGEGNDFIYGGAGHDVLIGGPGADWLIALASNDVLLSSGDGIRDTVRGGGGFDSAVGDDLDDVLECEVT